jgi:hypothetical protein
MGRLVCHQTTVAAKEPSNAQNASQRHSGGQRDSGTAGQRDSASGTGVFWVGSIDQETTSRTFQIALLLRCGILVTEVKSLISRFTAFVSLI